MGVHTALATSIERNWQILNPAPHKAEIFFPPNMVMLYTIGKSWRAEQLLQKSDRPKMKLDVQKF